MSAIVSIILCSLPLVVWVLIKFVKNPLSNLLKTSTFWFIIVSCVLVALFFVLYYLFVQEMVNKLRFILAYKDNWVKCLEKSREEILRFFSKEVRDCFHKKIPNWAYSELKNTYLILILMIESGSNITELEKKLEILFDVAYTQIVFDNPIFGYIDYLDQPSVQFEIKTPISNVKYINGNPEH